MQRPLIIGVMVMGGKQVITLNFDPGSGFQSAIASGRVVMAGSAEEVVRIIERVEARHAPRPR